MSARLHGASTPVSRTLAAVSVATLIALAVGLGCNREPTIADWTETDYLTRAASAGDWGKAEQHLKAGADPNGLLVDKGTPLFMLSHSLYVESVKFLVEKGADPNLPVKAHGGRTPIMGAAELSSPEMVRYLLSVGADPNHRADNGDTAITIAKKRGDPAVIEALGAGQPGA